MTDNANADIEALKGELREAFDRMIGDIQAARDAIDSPELHPAPATERRLRCQRLGSWSRLPKRDRWRWLRILWWSGRYRRRSRFGMPSETRGAS